jgi:hypothetical protein
MTRLVRGVLTAAKSRIRAERVERGIAPALIAQTVRFALVALTG